MAARRPTAAPPEPTIAEFGNLQPHHLAMLSEESGIAHEVIKARGYRTVTSKAELKFKGFSDAQCSAPTLLIPMYGVNGEIVLYQSRPDSPRIDRKSGKPVKYETPKGSSMALDVHPFARDKLQDPSVPLFITEGIKKGDALVSHDLCAVALIGVWNWRGTNEHGGKKALADWESVALNGRKVYVVFDSDVMEKQAVRASLVRLKVFLESRKAEVRLIYLPHGEGGKKQGGDDFLASGKTTDDLLSFATPELRRFETDEVDSALPEIQVNARHLRDITQDALAALEKANEPPTVFIRGSVLARINGEARVEILNRDALRGTLDRVANFVTYKADANATVPARPPADLAPDIMALPNLPFPRLEGVSTVPLFMPDGSLLLTSGYHAESGLYLHLDGLESLHTKMSVTEARDRLEELYIDFPFADDAGKAHTLCMLFEPFVQRIVGSVTPFYLVDAPMRGTGKGLLTDVTASIVTGRTAPVMALPNEGDELEKRVTSALLEGTTYLLLDNVTSLKSPVLAAAITSSVWRGRRLGQSQMLEVANSSTWIATGNNVELSDEIARRVIPIRLDPGVERPEHRTGFRHPNLKTYVLANRSSLVSACLSLVQAWVSEGMPQGGETLGSFETWCGVMGGILEVSGVSGFLSGRQRLYEDADRETAEWGLLCTAWFESFGERPVAARDIFAVAKERELLLDLWGGRSELSALQRVGRALHSRRDRIFSSFAVRLSGQDSTTKSSTYRLEQRVGKQTPETPRNPVKHVQDDKSLTGFTNRNPRNDSETPVKPPPNPRERNTVQDDESPISTGVYGVSGVVNPLSEQSSREGIAVEEGAVEI